jgi:hypothetical protein
MFGTVSLSQHSTQFVRHIVTDIKCAEIQTSIHSYSGVARQGITHYQNFPWHAHLLHLFIKMTDIIVFFEFLLSRLWELFSFIYHSISKFVLHTIYFVSNIPMFAFRTSNFRNSVIWYNSFRTSIRFFPNNFWRTEMSIPNIRCRIRMFGMTAAKLLEATICECQKIQFRTIDVTNVRQLLTKEYSWRNRYRHKM